MFCCLIYMSTVKYCISHAMQLTWPVYDDSNSHKSKLQCVVSVAPSGPVVCEFGFCYTSLSSRAVVETCLKMPLVVQTNKKCGLSSKSAYNAQDLLLQTHKEYKFNVQSHWLMKGRPCMSASVTSLNYWWS